MNEARSVHTTVVVPVWDRYVSLALEEALPSVLDQAADARVLVVDNASTVPIPKLIAADVVHSSQRLPLGGARNLGLEHVRTPYVIFWDADDVMLPGTLALLEAGIDSSPGLAAFAAGIVETSGARHRWPRPWVRPLSRVRPLFSLLHCVWSLLPSTGATIIRSDLLRAGGGFGGDQSGDDWVAGVSLVFRGQIGWSTRPGRVYRVHDESIWARHMSARHQVAHARAVRERIREDRGIPAWMRLLLPAIAVGQYAAIALQFALASLRRTNSPPGRRGR